MLAGSLFEAIPIVRKRCMRCRKVLEVHSIYRDEIVWYLLYVVLQFWETIHDNGTNLWGMRQHR